MRESGKALPGWAVARWCLAVVGALLAVAPGAPGGRGQDAATAAAELDKKLIAEVKAGAEIMTNLHHVSDIIGPRLTGSPALKRANDWTVDRMKRYGLANVRLEPWSLPEGWERGSAFARVVEPDNGRTLTVAAMGWSPGTKGRIAADVVAVQAKTSAELAQYKGKLKDAIVLRAPPSRVRPINEPPMAEGPTTPRQGDRGGFGLQREVADLARKEGAAAVLLDAGKPQGLLSMSGGWPRGGDRASAESRIPMLFTAHEHYSLLWRLATRPGARTRVELEVSNKFLPGPIAVYNTVGEVRGKEKPDEFVVVGAHLDSWDLAQGTTDNGTGVCVVLEAARAIVKSGVQPRRTIRFVLFTGEEQGLHGSRAYVERHKDEMERTSVALVHDTGTGKVQGVGASNRPGVKSILEAELVSLKGLGLTEVVGRGMGGSDHMSFDRAGVPGFMLRQDMTEYRFTHHSQTDTLDKAHEANLVQGAQVLAVTAMRLANLEKLLPHEKR